MTDHLERLKGIAPDLAKALGAVGPVDCVLAAGNCERSPGREILAGVEAFVDRQRDRYQLARAGCLVLDLFVKRSWLQSAVLTIESSAEIDDSGGSYWACNLSVTEVKAMEGEGLHEDLLDADGELDQDAAEEDVWQHFEVVQSEFGEAFKDSGDTSDVVVTVDRDLVAHLLAMPDPVSGAAAAALLWPEYQHQLSYESQGAGA